MTTSISIDNRVAHPNCAASANNRAFQLPLPLLDAACDGSLILFAGAGISTENKLAFPLTFYDEIRSTLRMEEAPPFKELMDEFCKQPNGRALLLNAIRSRFERVKLWPEILLASTRFHQVVATIPQLENIITTNWDDFFEIVCNAVPFVTGEDFIFWNTAGRKVFKIHGSVNSYGSIVAASADYQRCYKELEAGLIGSNLRMLLATRTVLFAGYSLRDAEFTRVYDLLTKEMGGMIPHAYIITLTDDSAVRFRDMGMTAIVTDATYYMENLRKHIVERGLLLDEVRFDGVRKKGAEIEARHMALSGLDEQLAPAILYTAMFHDGILSAFAHALASRSTGTFYDPHRVSHLMHEISTSLAEMESLGRYEDVAYLQGQLDAYFFIIASDESRLHFPSYFVFGVKDAIFTQEAFLEDAKRAAELHPSAYERARTILEKHAGNELAIHHTPHLYC
jgi:hypothetical protein